MREEGLPHRRAGWAGGDDSPVKPQPAEVSAAAGEQQSRVAQVQNRWIKC